MILKCSLYSLYFEDANSVSPFTKKKVSPQFEEEEGVKAREEGGVKILDVGGATPIGPRLLLLSPPGGSTEGGKGRKDGAETKRGAIPSIPGSRDEVMTG